MPSPAAVEAPADAWVASLVGRLRPGERVLVLGRSRAALSLVRRWASRQGGALGLEVAAAGALAAQLHPAAPVPADALPAHTALGARIGDRPGLARLAQQWAREARLGRGLGRPVAIPDRLAELLDGDFGRSAEDESLLALLASVRARGAELTASLRWDRVVTIGFADEPAFLPAAEAAVADALAGPLPPPWPEREGPLPAAFVPDVVAEARLAAHLAAEDPAGTLILVSADATARRVRDALDRNGLGGALRDPTLLGVHPVASAARRAVGWFAGDDPSILATDLFFVFGRTALGRRLHPAAAAWIGERLAADPDADRFDARDLAGVLEASRLRDAPLARWQERCDALADAATEPAERRAAVHLGARLRILDACARGTSLEDAFPSARPAPLDDFEDALRELLGDAPGPAVPAAGTLGALARFLVELRLRVHDDPVARALLGALRARAERPATPARVHEAISGPGLDPGLLADGVDVLLLSDWDGRPCRTLVVLDVHDHGLARPHPPDPILTDDEIRGLGIPTGHDRLAHGLRTLRRAAGRAERTVLVVTHTDASGRDTVPPIDLALVPADLPPAGSYGAGLPLPELLRHRRIRSVDADPGPPGPTPDAEDRARLARAATLEWWLDGRHPHPALPALETPASLSAVLRAAAATLPPALLPWLGHAEGAPEAALPDRAHSVSRLLQPITRCAFQAYAQVVLDVRPRAELRDDLDPRELGTVAHRALERAAPALDPGRLADDGEVEGAIASLREATAAAFDEELAQFGALSPARTASAIGLRARWQQHFVAWVRTRRRWVALRGFEAIHHPAVVAAAERLRQAAPALQGTDGYALRSWIVSHRDDPATLDERELRRVSEGRWLPPAAAPDLAGFLGDPSMDAVRAALREATSHRDLVQGRWDRTLVLAEVPFGRPDAPAAPVHGLPGAALSLPTARLRFGAADLQLAGQIDRIDALVAGGRAGLVVTDYKTGRAAITGSEFRRDQWTLEDPQLLVYAMVLTRAAREGLLPPELPPVVAAVASDRVRQTWKDGDLPGRTPDAPDSWLPVDHRLLRLAAQDLGVLIDGARAGRWPLRPHRYRCPKLARDGRCDVADGCRLRALPAHAP